MRINVEMNEQLKGIVEALRFAGAEPWIVGGFVRDAVIRRELGWNDVDSKDMDFEVFRIEPAKMINILASHARIDEVGSDFSVIKVSLNNGEIIDFSMPRKDNKVGSGHKGFEVTVDPWMAREEAAKRRDFRMNAMFADPQTGEIFDPFGGIEDIEMRRLTPVDAHFMEDPLRVLRGMQFAARFNMSLADSEFARAMCAEMLVGFFDLSRERIAEEWMKWATKSRVPSAGIKFLIDAGWIVPSATKEDHARLAAHVEDVRQQRAKFLKVLTDLHPQSDPVHLVEHARESIPFNKNLIWAVGVFPEIALMAGAAQDPIWHPEGDTLVHTMHVCDAMVAKNISDEIVDDEQIAARMFAALLHDVGKPDTFEIGEDGRIHNPAHAEVGEEIARVFMRKLFKSDLQDKDGVFIDAVAAMVKLHMRHIGFEGSKPQVRKLALQIPMKDLAAIVVADHSGRPWKGQLIVPAQMTHMLEVAEEIQVIDAKPQALIMGRDLIQWFGMKQSPQIGVVQKAAFAAQIEGDFDTFEHGILWIAAAFNMAVVAQN